MKQLKGKLLTAEQSARLAMLSRLKRVEAIKLIVTHLRKDSATHSVSWGGAPRRAYAAPIGQ